jgi:hypothetical protein
LYEGLAEVGESGGGLGLKLTLGDGGEKTAQGAAEVAGGEITARKEGGYIPASFLGGERLRFLSSMEGAQVRMAGAAGSAALAAIGESESTQAGTVFLMCDRRAVNGTIGGHRSLQKRRI